jgi:Ni/Co efflux regulator RcnB
MWIADVLVHCRAVPETVVSSAAEPIALLDDMDQGPISLGSKSHLEHEKLDAAVQEKDRDKKRHKKHKKHKKHHKKEKKHHKKGDSSVTGRCCCDGRPASGIRFF